MKWCRFKSGDQTTYGIIEGDTVTEVSGSPFDSYTQTSNTQPPLAIITAARHWDCEYVWASHSAAALRAGARPEAVEIIANGG